MPSFDEEVSLVVEHFRPKPSFATDKVVEWEGSRKRTRRLRTTTTRDDFSSVSYHRGKTHSCLRLAYLVEWSTSFVLAMQVGTESPYRVSLANIVPNVACNDNDEDKIGIDDGIMMYPPSRVIQRTITDMCDSLNRKGALSLFAMVSLLLKDLNDVSLSGKFGTLDRPDPSRSAIYEQHLQALVSQQQHNNKQREMDLAILLLRCAALSPRNIALCWPLPHAFTAVNGYNESIPIVKRILSLPSMKTMKTMLTYCDTKKNTKNQVPSIPPAKELIPWIALFQSLPWIRHGSLGPVDRLVPDWAKDTKILAEHHQNNITFILTLDLKDAAGYDTPRFAREAQKSGRLLQRVYHGTQIQHVWSILQYGLHPVSSQNNKLPQSNGAIDGEGVYVSPFLHHARRYARRNPSNIYARALQSALHHDSVKEVLGVDNNDSSLLNNLNCYTIQCFPVFEATVVAPPKNPTRGNNWKKTGLASQYVIPNAHNVRLDKLHLTFDLKRKSTFPGWWMLVCGLVVITILFFKNG